MMSTFKSAGKKRFIIQIISNTLECISNEYLEHLKI